MRVGLVVAMLLALAGAAGGAEVVCGGFGPISDPDVCARLGPVMDPEGAPQTGVRIGPCVDPYGQPSTCVRMGPGIDPHGSPGSESGESGNAQTPLIGAQVAPGG